MGHVYQSEVNFSLNFDFSLFKSKFFRRFFQRMGLFALYFAISLLGLVVRGIYRVPQVCLRYEIIDKEENTMKSIIADRPECQCHYTNFLWNKFAVENQNLLLMNSTLKTVEMGRHFEPWAVVR